MLSGKLIKNECIWEEGNWREPGGRSKKKTNKKTKRGELQIWCEQCAISWGETLPQFCVVEV